MDGQICDHPEADLILHLIAAHHGRARPHFETDAWDVERHTTAQNAQAAQEVMRRFARLQERFGRWGLAWFESLLRCADALASRQAAEHSISPQSQELRHEHT
jgi:CRISPR-associated endonuclease/helicase Cas3